MAKHNLLAVIDEALATLKTARLALAIESHGTSGTLPARKADSPKRGISEEGRQRIAEAQRKRWGKQKRAAKKAARLAGK